MNHMTQSNKQGWDRLAEVHYKNYHIDRLLSGTPLLNDLIRSEVGEVQGKSLVHPLRHIGTDTLSWALLGAKVTGIDISPKSLHYARLLADRMGIDALKNYIDQPNDKKDFNSLISYAKLNRGKMIMMP